MNRTKLVSIAFTIVTFGSASFAEAASDKARTPGLVCHDEVTKVQELVRLYDHAMRSGQFGESGKISDLIQGVLFPDVGSRGRCFQKAAFAYLESSLRILGAAQNKSDELAVTASWLSKESRLKFAGPRSLERMTKGKTREDSEQILADCEDWSYLIDVTLPPLNLAAIFIHDVDHAWRDRLGKFPQLFATGFNYFLDDEMFATLHASVSQKIYAQNYSLEQRLPLKRPDLNLFRPNGPLAALWKQLQPQSFNSLLMGIQAALEGRLGDSAKREVAQAIEAFGLLAKKSYFPGGKSQFDIDIFRGFISSGANPLAVTLASADSHTGVLNDIEMMWHLSKLEGPTYSCRQFQTSSLERDMSHYVGFLPRRHGHQKSRTGKDSVRPGKGLRPGKDSVRPAQALSL